MPSEQQIQSKISTYLTNQKCYWVKVVSATKKGVPDLLVCYKGLFIGIEVKRPSTKTNVSKLQVYNLDKIKEAGGISVVVWDVEQVKDLLERLDDVTRD